VIDLTWYDIPATEPSDMTRRWSLMGEVNQKQTRPQDTPRSFRELPAGARRRVAARYPEFTGK
jgi:hypothetical protein